MNRSAVLTVASAVLAGAGLSACGGPSVVVGPTPSAAPTAAAVAHLAQLPRGALHAATLDVASGTTDLAITMGRVPGALLTASTPLASGQRPSLALDPAGVANLQLASTGGVGGSSALDVVLDQTVTWTIDLDGGATDETLDLRAGHVRVVDLAAGTSRATIKLPAQAGTETVREAGGASELTVSAPRAVATRVKVGGGAARVHIGTTTHTGVGGNQTFTDPGYSEAADRLDLVLVGGASDVHVNRT